MSNLGAGFPGSGTLTIQDAMKVASANGSLGYKISSTGTAIVSGTSSTWTINNSLVVGNSGTGMLNVNGGGRSVMCPPAISA